MSDENKVVVYSSTAYSPYGDSVDYVKYSAYADLKAENERLNNYTILGYETMLAELKAENEKLRKLLTNITKEQSFIEFELNIEIARQALGDK